MSHEKRLAKGFQDLREDELLFDYTLVAEGESIPVHKVVMAACSDYFKALFTGDMKESKDSRVELKQVTAKGLRSLVDYAYTGKLHPSMKTIEDMVSAASYFQMENALEECVSYLRVRMFEEHYESSVDIFNIAQMFSLPILDDAEGFLADHIEVISDDCLSRLPGDSLVKVLGRGDLNVASEYELFKKVISWIKNPAAPVEDMIYSLMSKIRFPLMSGKDIAQVSESQVMTSSPRLHDLLTEALEYHKDVLKQPLMQTERTQVRNDNYSFIVATEKSYKTDKTLYVTIMEPDDAKEKEVFTNQMVVSVDNYLYVCGSSASFESDDNSFFDSDRFYRYDPRFNTWLKLPSMTGKRYYFELIPCKEFIYAFGGNSDKLVERYSIKDNKWESRATMDNQRCGMAGAELDNRIYLCGGFVATNIPEKSLDCYHPSTDTWESKAPMNYGRMLHIMKRISDKLYVLGGRWSSLVEYYSPSVNQWTSCNRLTIDAVGAFISDEVYLLGMESWNEDEDKVYMLHRYDAGSGKTVSLAEEIDFNDDELDFPGCDHMLDIVSCVVLKTRRMYFQKTVEDSCETSDMSSSKQSQTSDSSE